MTDVVVGIDPSLTHTGLCRAVDGREQQCSSVITVPGKPRPSRLIQVRDQVRGFILRGLPNSARLVVVMESQIWSHNPEVFAADASLYGVLETMVWEVFGQRVREGGKFVSVHPVQEGSSRFVSTNPQQVKKWLGAKEKAEVLLRVYKLYNREFRDHNEADAYALAMMGCSLLRYISGTDPEVTKAQMEVLDKLLKKGLPWETPPEPRRRRGRKEAR